MSLKTKYKEYMFDGDTFIAHDILIGTLGVLSYTQAGWIGVFLVFIVMDFLGFMIYVKGWDEKNPFIKKSRDMRGY